MTDVLSAILITWVLSSVVFIGIGLALARLAGRFEFRPRHLVILFWIGWCGVVVVLQIWHLFFPVNVNTAVVIGLLGATGLSLNGRAIVGLLSVRPRLAIGFATVALLLLALWLANRSLSAPRNPDSGLYHLSAVRWNATYRIVPGIVNLHRVLAYNSSYFLYVALYEFGAWWGKSHYIANGVLVFWTLAPLVCSLMKLFCNREASPLPGLFASVLFIPMLWQILGYNLTSPSPDLAVYLLQIIGAYWIVELAADQGQCASDGVLRSWAVALVVVVSVTVKLSFLGFAAGLLLALVALRFGQPALRRESFRKVASLATVIAVSAVGVWMLRGVLLSGYPAYPLPFLGLPVKWAATPEEVLDQFNMLRAWGWVPNVHWKQVLGNWDWFASWIKHLASNRFVVVQPFALVGAATLIILLRQVRHQPIQERIGALWPILLPPVIGTIYWLVSAPDVRWSGSCFWVLAAALLVLALAGLSRPALALCSGVLTLRAGAVLAAHLFVGPLWLPGHRDGFFYPTETAVVRPLVTNSGLMLYVPHTGFRCWSAPLPCTPEPNSRLRLRRPGDLQSGFIVDR